jgi:hypothetical protein
MYLLLSVPACGLATYALLRCVRVPWNVGLALAAVASPFVPFAAVGAAIGVLYTLRRGGLDPAPRSWTRRAFGLRGPLMINDVGLAIGSDARGQLVRIPLRRQSGAHTLIVGATGSGKTVTEAWILARAIDHGHGAVIVDPKGDVALREAARDGALRAGRRFIEWTPDGPAVYNPYGHGSAGEIADKALAGERFTEPHYLRQAQRYLAHAVRALQAWGRPSRRAGWWR